MAPSLTFVSPLACSRRSCIVQICPYHPRLPRYRRLQRAKPIEQRFCRITPTAASGAPTKTITEGTLVEILSSTRRCLARAIRPDGKRNWFVEDAALQTSSVNPKQITYIVGHPSESPDLDVDLATLHARAVEKAHNHIELLETAWEIIASGDGIDGSTTTSVPHIAAMVMEDESRLALLATHILLTEDMFFFKGKVVKGVALYDARTEAQVAEARLMREIQERRKEQEAQRYIDLAKAYNERDITTFRNVFGNDVDSYFQHLEDMALELGTSSNIDGRYGTATNTVFQQLTNEEKTVVRELFAAFDLPTMPSSALQILIQLRIFTRHENLFLRNANIPQWTDVDNITRAEIDRLLNNGAEDVDKESRVDLTHMNTIAIDSADTSEVDDAFSYDVQTDTVYVHIADPSRYFPSGIDNPLLEEVLRRVATLYLPSAKFTMFPEEIATRMISLDGDIFDGSAVSFAFKVEADGSISEEGMQILVSKVCKPVRMTYEEADVALADPNCDGLLQSVRDAMARRKRWREMEGGAIMIQSPMSNVVVDGADSDEPVVEVRVVDTDTPSWLTVAELMISSCTIGAAFAAKHGFAVPFRGQEPFDYPADEILESVPNGPVRAALAFRQATPSFVGTVPKEHASLGLDSYVQVTSPIRRSLDLIAQMQLKAWLRHGDGSDDMLPVEVVEREISRSQTTSRILRSTENKTTKYWQFEFLNRCQREGRQYNGTYVRATKEGDMNRVGIVHLDDLGFSITAEIGAAVFVGDKVVVEIISVDVRRSNVRAVARMVAAGDMDMLTDFDDLLSNVSEDWS